MNSLISDFYKDKYHISSPSLIALMEIFFSLTVAIEKLDEVLEHAIDTGATEVEMQPEEVVLLTTLMRGALQASSLKFDNNISLAEN